MYSDSESDDDIFNDDGDILEIIEFGFPRKRYDRSEHFETLDELSFFRRFRLKKDTVLHLLTLLEETLEYPTDLNNSVSPVNQLLATLRFYASSGHLLSVADFIGMDKSTASRIVAKVTLGIAQLYRRYISFPEPQAIPKSQTDFYSVAAFPKVIGCIDGTHIRIQSPGGEDAEIFRNRKGYFSVNTQVVCDSDLRILDLVARWPGSTHDATMFNNSRLKARFETGEFPNCVLLGDSGYFLRNYLLTPIANPNNRAEHLYNEAHIRTRNCVERCIGVWKRRFPVIAYGMRLKLETQLQIIIATAVLHNLAKDMHEEEPMRAEDIDEVELNYLIEIGNIEDVPGEDQNVAINTFRNNLINNFFRNL